MSNSSEHTTTPRVSVVVLNTSSDWHEWIYVIKLKATVSDIWEHINPDTPKDDIPALSEPERPTPSEVRQAATRIADLSAAEREEYQDLIRQYRRDLDLYDRRKRGIATIQNHIIESLNRKHLIYTFDCDTTHDILVSLKNRFKPTNEARERELTLQYQRLKTLTTRNMNMEDWLLQWEKTCRECRQLNLPDVAGIRPVRDFVYAIHNVDSEFALGWRHQLAREQVDPNMEIRDIVQEFRNWKREAPRDDREYHGAFEATFQGHPISGKRRDCVCGEDHRFKECPYLVDSKRPPNWKPDSAIQQQIEEKLKNPRLKETINRIRREDLPTAF